MTQNEPAWQALGGIPTNAGGFRITDRPEGLEKAALVALWPLKRSYIRPWFRVIARVGTTGNDEDFLDPDEDAPTHQKVTLVGKFKPKRDGELYIYVNSAVLAGASLKKYLRYFDYPYTLNEGTAEIKVERIPN